VEIPTDRFQQALDIIHELLGTCELNMDDMEPETLQAITRASQFQNECAVKGHRAKQETETYGNTVFHRGIASHRPMRISQVVKHNQFNWCSICHFWFEPLGKKSEQGSSLTPVIAILTAFTAALVLLAQSSLLHAVLARLAEVR